MMFRSRPVSLTLKRRHYASSLDFNVDDNKLLCELRRERKPDSISLDGLLIAGRTHTHTHFCKCGRSQISFYWLPLCNWKRTERDKRSFRVKMMNAWSVVCHKSEWSSVNWKEWKAVVDDGGSLWMMWTVWKLFKCKSRWIDRSKKIILSH